MYNEIHYDAEPEWFPDEAQAKKAIACQQWPEPSTADDNEFPFANLKIPMGHAIAN